MREAGFRRLVGFSDAVVAIAITLLVLPLVDSAGGLGKESLGTFFGHEWPKLFAFGLSFAVIGGFWWGHHQMLEGVRDYNAVLVWGLFLWLVAIVFLPFPTELLGSSKGSTPAVHAIYVGTMLLASAAVLLQSWATVRWPELREEGEWRARTLDSAVILTVLMGVALVVVVAAPAIGLWSLLLLALARPLEQLVGVRRARRRARS